jgi:predicted  nucleic acid-binding Zn-ribbon protein
MTAIRANHPCLTEGTSGREALDAEKSTKEQRPSEARRAVSGNCSKLVHDMVSMVINFARVATIRIVNNGNYQIRKCFDRENYRFSQKDGKLSQIRDLKVINSMNRQARGDRRFRWSPHH